MNKFLVSFAFVCLLTEAYSQITIEKKYTAGDKVGLINLEGLGNKYCLIKTTKSSDSKSLNSSIVIYNVDHSVYKNITVPTYTVGKNKSIYGVDIWNFTTKLFNNDPAIEFTTVLYQYDTIGNTTNSVSMIKIFNENGASLFQIDSASSSIFELSKVGGPYIGIDRVDGKYKMIIHSHKKSDGAKLYNPVPIIYSLPGSLPEPLAVNESEQRNDAKASLSSPIPNPSQYYTRVEFTLPPEMAMGEIMVYNSLGLKMKSYVVDNTFGDLLLNNTDMPSGNYYYHLISGGKRIGSQKMLIIK